MKQGLNESDWGLVGAKLANASDQEQARFFKAFLKECKTWGTLIQIEYQFTHVNKRLTQEEKEMLSMISYEEGSNG